MSDERERERGCVVTSRLLVPGVMSDSGYSDACPDAMSSYRNELCNVG